MHLWHILVLGVVKSEMNIDWDRLSYTANHDILVRQLMGVHSTGFNLAAQYQFNHQTIKDNEQLLDEVTLM